MTNQDGSLCTACSKGILRIKRGRYGTFLGCDRFPKCRHAENVSVNLENQATQLLKKKHKKTRRSKKKRVTSWDKKVKESMAEYKKQKKERGQMFKDFERLIGE